MIRAAWLTFLNDLPVYLFGAWVITMIWRRWTGRYPWEAPNRYVITVLAWLDDGPSLPRVLHRVERKSMLAAQETAGAFHSELSKDEQFKDRYAVNVSINPQ